MNAPGAVIAGGGLAAQRCAETLRARGHDDPITMICGELELPYDRPPLSKGLLSGKIADGQTRFRDHDWYRDNEVELLIGTEASALRPVARRVELADGRSVPYESLLIATGAAPRMLPQLAHHANAQTLRTIDDARRLRCELRPGARLVIIGAGFIGQEVAATAVAAGAEVTIIEALPLPLAGALGDAVGRWIVDLHTDQGVRMLLSSRLERVRGNGRVEELILEDGRRVDCDAVVVGVGVAPAARWVAGSGLDADGVKTDAAGRTTIPGVFAAGDVARPFNARRGSHAPSEHWDAASRQGAVVARAMLGEPPPPPPPPSFWSDQYGLRIQYAGDAAGADSVSVDGDPAGHDFSVLYRRDERPVAALTVGRPRELLALRRRIESADEAQVSQTETKETVR